MSVDDTHDRNATAPINATLVWTVDDAIFVGGKMWSGKISER